MLISELIGPCTWRFTPDKKWVITCYNPSFLVVMENHHFQSENHHTIADCKQIIGGQHPLLPFSLLKSNEVTPTVEKPTPQTSENVMAGNFFNNPPGLCQFIQIYESSGVYHGFIPHQNNHGLSTPPKKAPRNGHEFAHLLTRGLARREAGDLPEPTRGAG